MDSKTVLAIIMNRIQNQKKALGAILPAGIVKAHSVYRKPMASLRADTINAVPVLFSGLVSLV